MEKSVSDRKGIDPMLVLGKAVDFGGGYDTKRHTQ